MVDIPITREMLLNNGFEKLYDNNYIKDKFRIWFNPPYEDDIYLFYNYETRIKIEYVHQLQNNWFNLSGEELKLEL